MAKIVDLRKHKSAWNAVDIPIDKNVPIPPSRGGRPFKYPFGEMLIGDSFTFAITDSVRVRPAATYFSKRNPKFKFTTRKQGDVIRIWRIK